MTRINSYYKFQLLFLILVSVCSTPLISRDKRQPNILFIISDDQSYPHASAYGCTWVNTPAFDRVAQAGVLFKNGYAAAPSCGPSRAAILTGKNIWELEEAGTMHSGFPNKFQVYPEILEDAGYQVGYTGKPWGPGNWKKYGWDRNPCGPAYGGNDTIPPARGMAKDNYYRNFADFYKSKKKDQPFCFWLGGKEPHRGYEFKSGAKHGKKIKEVEVPAFLPDRDSIRHDLADYALEIEYFDWHAGKVIELLEEVGVLDNTLVIYTSDNGMPFSRAKVNCYEYGVHVPLAMSWGDKIKSGQVNNSMVGFSDLAPTILHAAGLPISENSTGESILPLISKEYSSKQYTSSDYVLFGKERHNYAREHNLGYPTRGIRMGDYLYLLNFEPERWPTGIAPLYRDSELYQLSGRVIENNKGTDEACNSAFHKVVDKRPSQELFNIKTDPACSINLAQEGTHKKILAEMDQRLREVLKTQKDPRMFGRGDVFDGYPYFYPGNYHVNGKSIMGGWFELGEYNPAIFNKQNNFKKNIIE